MGANQGGAKGNRQEAKYQKPERKHGKPGEEKVEDGEAERRSRALEKPLMRRGQEEGNGRTAG